MAKSSFTRSLLKFCLVVLIGFLALVAYLWFSGAGRDKPVVEEGPHGPVIAGPSETTPVEIDEEGKPVAPAKPLEGDAAFAAKICHDGLLAAAEKPGTLFGHIAQSPAGAGSLTAAPSGFNISNCGTMNSDMAAAIAAMRDAAMAADPNIGRNLAGVSCYRNDVKQRDLYCRADRLAERGYQGQAYWVAPPGFSEHATGRAIDFGDRSRPDCNVNPCFGETAVGRWLAANAGKFGFRMSFPPGNAQGVASEAWHFLYVGGSRSWPTSVRVPPVPERRSPIIDPPASDAAASSRPASEAATSGNRGTPTNLLPPGMGGDAPAGRATTGG